LVLTTRAIRIDELALGMPRDGQAKSIPRRSHYGPSVTVVHLEAYHSGGWDDI
jgi:hypothetical protein